MILLLKKEGGTIIMKGIGTFIFLLVTIESMLFLAMQVRVMAACMESQIDK